MDFFQLFQFSAWFSVYLLFQYVTASSTQKYIMCLQASPDIDWTQCEKETFNHFTVLCENEEVDFILCDGGTFFNWSCGNEIPVSPGHCSQCPRNQYQAQYNNCPRCRPCSHCPEGYVEQTPCDGEADTVCVPSPTERPQEMNQTVPDSPVTNFTTDSTVDPDTTPVIVTGAESDSRKPKWDSWHVGLLVSTLVLLFTCIAEGLYIIHPHKNRADPKLTQRQGSATDDSSVLMEGVSKKDSREAKFVQTNGPQSPTVSPEQAPRSQQQTAAVSDQCVVDMTSQGLPSSGPSQVGEQDGPTDADRLTDSTHRTRNDFTDSLLNCQGQQTTLSRKSERVPLASGEELDDEMTQLLAGLGHEGAPDHEGITSKQSTAAARLGSEPAGRDGITDGRVTCSHGATGGDGVSQGGEESPQGGRGDSQQNGVDDSQQNGMDRAEPAGNPAAHGAGAKRKGMVLGRNGMQQKFEREGEEYEMEQLCPTNQNAMVTENFLDKTADKISSLSVNRVCRALGLEQIQIDDFKYYYRDSKEDIKFRVLNEVLKMQGERLTYRRVLQALEESDNKSAAELLRREFRIQEN